MIEYKGYLATVEYDDSVGRLHGRVAKQRVPILSLHLKRRT